MRRSIIMCSRATDRRSAPKCQGKRPDQPIDHRSGWPEGWQPPEPRIGLARSPMPVRILTSGRGHPGNPAQYTTSMASAASERFSIEVPGTATITTATPPPTPASSRDAALRPSLQAWRGRQRLGRQEDWQRIYSIEDARHKYISEDTLKPSRIARIALPPAALGKMRSSRPASIASTARRCVTSS